MAAAPKFRRILLKVSGEALMGAQNFGIDIETVERIAADIKEASDVGAQVCLVIGGGNIFRGLAGAAKGIDRATADYMGMLATVMNALAMQAALERAGLPTRVQSAIPMMTRLRALYPPPRDPAYGKGPGRHICRRHRQSLLHDRHGGSTAGGRDELRRDAQGHASRRCLQCRSRKSRPMPSVTIP